MKFPWRSVIEVARTVIKGASELRQEATAEKTASHDSETILLDELRRRLDTAQENQDRQAEMLGRLAEQVEHLTGALKATVARQKVLLIFTLASMLLSFALLIVFLVR